MKGYDIKVRLDEFRPLTWRDLIIPENITFHQLHLMLQELWDFNDYHLYEFTTTDYKTKVVDFKRNGGLDFYIPEYDEYDSKKTFIGKLFDSSSKLKYYYDFGDSWSFTIEIKGKIDYDNTFPLLKRYKGEYNPIEDCGGIPRLIDIIEHPEDYEEELNIFDFEDKQDSLKILYDFDNNKKVILDNQDEFVDSLIDQEDNLPFNKNVSFDDDFFDEDFVEEILGKKGELSELFNELVNDGILTNERAFEVQSQLIDELKEGVVKFEGLINRINFLSNKENMESVLKMINLLNPHSKDICPYCQMDLDDSVGFCNLCGFNLNYEPQEGDDRFTTNRDSAPAKMILKKIAENTFANSSYNNKNKYVYFLDGMYDKDNEDSIFKIISYNLLKLLNTDPRLEYYLDRPSIYQIVDESELLDFIYSNDLLDDKINFQSWKQLASNLTITDLKKYLKENNQKISGKKDELIERLYETLDVTEIFNKKYPDEELAFITQNGFDFIKNHEYTRKYENYLKKFSYNEFEEYYEKNNKDIVESIISFLNLHESNALGNSNQKHYVTVLEAKRYILMKEKMSVEDMILNEIKIFNAYLNPMENTMADKHGRLIRINTDNVKHIRKLNKKSEINPNLLKDIYNNAKHKQFYSLNNTIGILRMVLDNHNLNLIRDTIKKI